MSFAERVARLESQWSPEMETRRNHALRRGPHPPAEPPVALSPPTARFALTDSAGWQAHLSEEGYAVLAGVLGPSEVSRAEDLLWEHLEASGMRRDQTESWPGNFAGDARTGIMALAGAPHSEFAWYVRSHPNVVRAFAELWGVSTAELISSFDAINVFRPFGERPELKTSGGWLHLDQNSYPPGRGKQGRHCVQGLVTIMDADQSSGSLVVVPRSLHRHDALCSRVQSVQGDFVPLSHLPSEDVLADSNVVLVCAAAGDLILWDSRQIHANTPALAGTQHRPDRLLRAVCYTCMVPRAWATDICIRDRQRAYCRDVGGTHWPHEFQARGSLDSEPVRSLQDAPEERRLLIGECPPVSRPSDEAMAAMEEANRLEAEGELGEAKRWIEKAIALGHNCLAEYGGWK